MWGGVWMLTPRTHGKTPCLQSKWYRGAGNDGVWKGVPMVGSWSGRVGRHGERSCQGAVVRRDSAQEACMLVTQEHLPQ